MPIPERSNFRFLMYTQIFENMIEIDSYSIANQRKTWVINSNNRYSFCCCNRYRCCSATTDRNSKRRNNIIKEDNDDDDEEEEEEEEEEKVEDHTINPKKKIGTKKSLVIAGF